MTRGVLLLAADGAVLVALWPTGCRAAGLIGGLDGAVDERGADAVLGVLAGGAVWLLAAYLAAALLSAVAAALPGRAGRLCRQVADRLLPRALQRLVAGSAGLGVLLAPVAAAAASSGPASPAPRATISSSAPVPTPSWPVDPAAAQPLPAPGWPTDAPPPDHRLGAPPQPLPPRTASPQRRPAPPPPRPARGAPPPTASDHVTVRPGDSLWLIAARRAGDAAGPGEIATEWPRWYVANRAEIGPDPDLIRPGQVLRAPGRARRGAP